MTLTLRDALDLSTIIRWAQSNAIVRWLDDRNEVQSGTVRSIGDERGNFLRADDEVRDSFVRITTSSGWEWFVPMKDILRLVRNDMMVRDK